MNEEDETREFVRSGAVSEGYHVLYDWSGDGSIVSTIVRAVTELSGRKPQERLHSRIDPDALEALFRRSPGEPGRDRGAVTFPFAGFDVTVDADGVIRLDEVDRGRHGSR